MSENDYIELTPDQYEVAVRNFIITQGENLTDFKVDLLEKVPTHDGEYEIDVTARFSVFGGAAIVVLIECKHYITSVVDRDKVMILNQKVQSAGAHKGMIFTTSKYRRGAVKFAKEHGISLAKLGPNIEYAVKSIRVNAYEVDIDEDEQIIYNIVCNGNALMG